MADVIQCTAGLGEIPDTWLEAAGDHTLHFVRGTLKDAQRLAVEDFEGANLLVFNVAPFTIDVDERLMAAVRDIVARPARPALLGLVDRRFAGTRARDRLIRAAREAGVDSVMPTWLGTEMLTWEVDRLSELEIDPESALELAGLTDRPTLDLDRRELVGPLGRAVLTGKEAALMAAFLDNSSIMSRQELSEVLWSQQEWEGTPKAIDMHIANLRRKLQLTCGQGWRITTVRGSGFMLEELEAVQDAS